MKNASLWNIYPNVSDAGGQFPTKPRDTSVSLRNKRKSQLRVPGIILEKQINNQTARRPHHLLVYIWISMHSAISSRMQRVRGCVIVAQSFPFLQIKMCQPGFARHRVIRRNSELRPSREKCCHEFNCFQEHHDLELT
ncbi:uncharacterized protein LOC143179542 [Calliopsis andreniformis]|uniref:uncharacterized protein LOC143179542 n=1 Tax=Calliopsis andreniformis TaxID=337506 RepID=UPI003FCCF136